MTVLTPRSPRRWRIATAATVGLLITGCGGNELAEMAAEVEEVLETAQPQPADTETSGGTEQAAATEIAPEQVPLDLEAVQVGAFEITFTEAVITPNEDEFTAEGTPYHIDLAFEAENVWSESAHRPLGRLAPSEVVLERGEDYIIMESAEVPEVPAGRMNTGTLTFAGSSELVPDVSGLTLVIGGPGHNQVVLPLDGSESTTLADIPFEVTADLAAGGRIKGARFEIHEGRVQFVSRGQNALLDADTALLVLSMTITGDSGNYGIHAGELILDRPDGTSVTNDQRLQQSGGVPLDHTVVFLIDQPIEGQYTLTIREEADVTFSIPR